MSWMGRCSNCGEWNSLVEKEEEKEKSLGIRELKPLTFREIKEHKFNRISSGFSELDLVLGGGIVDSSLVLVGGDPGVGKSTLLLQLANNVSKEKKVIYVSAEESLSQIKLRAKRVGAYDSELLILSENNFQSIVNCITIEKPDIIIIDSIQTMHDDRINSSQGSVSQVREITNQLMEISKKNSIVTFIIGHVTKEGAIAGPKVLEHIVDTVIYFEGEKNSVYRLVRAVKNRFGSTNELGIFEMLESGLKAVDNPSELFIEARPQNAPGSAISASLEGTRPLLVEVQALTSISTYPSPRRIGIGVDYNRLSLLLAVMEKKLNISMNTFDVYINLVGGVNIHEPALDLTIVASLISSYRNKAIDPEVLLFGEVGLTGEIRAVSEAEKRVKESVKLGFKKIILPKTNQKISIEDAKIHQVEKLTDVIGLLF